MNNLSKKELTLDSRDVAEMVGKRHSDLIRDIEKYIGYLGQNAKLRSGGISTITDFFQESSYISGNPPREYKNYQITKKGCDMIAHKLTGKKGVLFTATYIDKFYEMENLLKDKKFSFNLSTKEDFIKLSLELTNKIIEQKPKVDLCEDFLIAENCLTTQEVAKSLNLKSPQELNKILIQEKVLLKNKKGLKSEYCEKGYFKLEKITKKGKVINRNLKWTSKGVEFIHNLLLNKGYVKRNRNGELIKTDKIEKRNFLKLVFAD